MRGLEGNSAVAQSIKSLITQILANTILESEDILPETTTSGTRLRVKIAANEKGTFPPVATNNGDLIAFDGRGWVVLEVGSANKVLKVGANGLEWGAGMPQGVEGDMLVWVGDGWALFPKGSEGDVLKWGPSGPYWTTGGTGNGGLPEGGVPGDVLRMGANGPYWENTSICY